MRDAPRATETTGQLKIWWKPNMFVTMTYPSSDVRLSYWQQILEYLRALYR